MERLTVTNARIGEKLYTIEMTDGVISAVREERAKGDLDAGGRRVIPGLVDVHAHGCIGMDALDGDFEPMCAFLGKNGTTTWLPTTMTMDAAT